ncbi:acetoin utilization protein AcuC [Nakamurella deserti]|uniref:acetoin utilization protein AcuC n=1 Tax=Nakamurella deserti TaxID=2164074 RepID=UPI000DBE75E7|nr:acetoin utilization protein AcuC [Nakamurella deserti]
MAAPLVVWDPGMLRYRWSDSHPMNPLRLELTMALAGELGVLDGLVPVSPVPADDAILRTVHTAEYIEAVRAASAPGLPPYRGDDDPHGLGTADDPVFAGMHDAAALIAGGSVRAARAIAAGEVTRAVNIAGGMHHAMPDRASGFCVYNDPALAIAALLDAGVERVAYVDVDVHHGDGVQAAFWDDPRVLTVSLHESPRTLFPGTGRPTEIGGPAAAGTAVNVALPAGTGDAGWLRAFHAVVPGVLQAFRPQVLVTQHGADAHAEDPLANLRLTVDGQRAAQLALRELADRLTDGRWLAVGGGGYAVVRVVPRTWTHLIAVVADRDVDPDTPLPAGFRRRASVHVRDDGTPGAGLPLTMSDGAVPDLRPWDGHGDTALDTAVLATRKAVLPLWGLDPFDPRD